MEPWLVGLIGFVVLFILLFAGLPVAFSIICVGFFGTAYFLGWVPALTKLASTPFRYICSVDLAAIPLFVFMAQVCTHAGFTRDLYNFMAKMIGHIRGGLASSTIAASAVFAAVSSSSVVTAATIGQLALPEMERHNYKDELALGSVAVGGTLGVLIPPSSILIFYGILAEVSISKLFMAGIIPGLLVAVGYLLVIFIWCRKDKSAGPASARATWKQRAKALVGCIEIIIVVGSILVGMATGFVTASEAAALAAVISIIMAIVRKRLDFKGFIRVGKDTLKSAGMIYLMLVSASLLNTFVALSHLPTIAISAINGLNVAPLLVMVVLSFFFLFLGCVMDTAAINAIFIPIVYPIVAGMGFDLIWFGIFYVRLCEIGMVTPPIGICSFIVANFAKKPLKSVFKGIAPFLASDIINVALLLLVPSIALFLPNLLFG